MALYKLEDDTSSVDMNPTRGWLIPETRIREHTETKEGPTDSHEWGNAEKHEVPLINLTKARADKLLEWWEDMKELTVTPPVGSPFQAIIDGIDRPLNMWYHKFDSKYAGMLRLCEVSSQSFSSSQVSISKSQSCSSFDASQSLGFSESLSCSAFLVDSSRSSSVGDDDSYSTSRSCSQSVSRSSSRSCFSFSVSLGPPNNFYVTLSECGNAVANVSVSSCEDQSSLGNSRSSGVIETITTSESCSLDPSESSLSESAAGTSCSLSAGGIS